MSRLYRGTASNSMYFDAEVRRIAPDIRNDDVVQITIRGLVYGGVWPCTRATATLSENVRLPLAVTRRHRNALAYFAGVMRDAESCAFELLGSDEGLRELCGEVDTRPAFYTLWSMRGEWRRSLGVVLVDDADYVPGTGFDYAWTEVGAAMTRSIDAMLTPSTMLMLVVPDDVDIAHEFNARSFSDWRFYGTLHVDFSDRLVLYDGATHTSFTARFHRHKVFTHRCDWSRLDEAKRAWHECLGARLKLLVHAGLNREYVIDSDADGWLFESLAFRTSTITLLKQLVDIGLALSGRLPTYELLAVVDRVPGMQYLTHARKVAVLHRMNRAAHRAVPIGAHIADRTRGGQRRRLALQAGIESAE